MIGLVRMSIHPTMTNTEIEFTCYPIDAVAKNFNTRKEDKNIRLLKISIFIRKIII